jgi:hypothetical protein
VDHRREPEPQLVGRGLQPGAGDAERIVEALAGESEDLWGVQVREKPGQFGAEARSRSEGRGSLREL